MFQDVAQLVARLFWEQGVAGSNPVILILVSFNALHNQNQNDLKFSIVFLSSC